MFPDLPGSGADRADWRHLLRAAPAAALQLAPPAREARLRLLERRLGRPLPPDYRSFLAVADGGWLGDRLVLGTTVLACLPEPLAGGGLLLPFHPANRLGFECLDLLRGTVVWVPARQRLAEPPDEDSEVGRLLRLQEPACADWAPTHTDFLDWALDALLALHGPPAGLTALS